MENSRFNTRIYFTLGLTGKQPAIGYATYKWPLTEVLPRPKL